MINTADFTKRLKKVIDYYGLSASGFADQLGVQRSSISHILSGRNKPSLDFVMKILSSFPEVELYWLLNGKGTFPKATTEKVATTPLPKKEQTVSQQNISLEDDSFQEIDTTEKKIAKIVFFYKDGTFEVYQK